MAVVNPGDEAAAVRAANPAEANRLALEALGVFHRLADYYPPLDARYRGGRPGEGHLLQRAVHRILEGWDYRPLLALFDLPEDRKSQRLNYSHSCASRMPASAL